MLNKIENVKRSRNETYVSRGAACDVTRRLGVGSGLLHYYFETRKSLWAEVVRVSITQEIVELEKVLAAAQPDRLAKTRVAWMVQDPAYQYWRL